MYIENKRMGIRLNLLVPTGLAILFKLNGFMPSFIMLLAALVHEMGHFLCVVALKTPVLRFDIELWGGRMYYGGMLGYKQEMLVALGGIIANIIVAPVGLIPAFGIYGKLFYYSCFCYALVNIIPAKTLDGGELFRCLIRLYGDAFSAERAEKIIHLLSVMFIVVAGVLFSLLTGFNSSVLFIVVFSVILLITETKKTWC